MADEAKHPRSPSTRGGGVEDWGSLHPRCVDCPQFLTLGNRVDRLEVVLTDVGKKLHTVERKQDAHARDLDDLKQNVSRVVRWLDGGGNGTDGFRVEWALLSTGIRKGISIRERLSWMVGGAVLLAVLAFAGSLAIDAIQRGITP